MISRTSVSHLAIFIVSLFLLMPLLGIATSGVNDSPEELESTTDLSYTHTSTSMNEPGFQAGSIFTNVTLSTGFSHTCAIVPDSSISSLQCWGEQGGYGGSSSSSTPVSVSLPSGKSPIYVSSGDDHTCIINNIGEVECIGSNSYGQGSHNWSQISSFNTAVSITSGDRHTCAILDNASIWCWGDNSLGELGFGTTTGTNEPAAFVNLPPGKTAVAAAAGRDFTCSILQDGSAYCWGENTRGQIGDGTTTNRNSPTQVSLPSGRLASALVTGQSHTCALLDNGSLWCWGHNVYGQLGDGTNCPAFNTNNGCNGNEGKNSPSQVLLPAGRTAISVSAGARHTCAILDNGSAMCWGQGGSGTLGAGLSTGFGHKQSTPVYVNLPTSHNATSIDVFGYHACVTLEDNSSAMCWGQNIGGQLGDGSTVDKNSPSYVNFAPSAHVIMSNRDIDGDGTLNIFDTHMPGGQEGSIYSDTQLSAGNDHTCAINNAGYLFCWGNNNNGQLGDGTTTSVRVPKNITLPSGLMAISVDTGYQNTCVVVSNGDLYCWGNNGEGQIGDGTATNRLSPTLVSLPSGRTAVEVAVGGQHVCAILDNGLPMCWGKDSHGQLGDGSPSQSKVTPVYVVMPNGATSALSISAGDYHTCMVVDTTNWASNPGPKAYCWGSGSNGKLGEGNNCCSRRSPVMVIDGTGSNQPLNARIVTTHSQHTCAIAGTPRGDSLQNSTESILCWGYNGHGQLGDGNVGSPFSTSSPVSVNIPAGRTVVTISIGYQISCATLDNGSAVCWGGVNPSGNAESYGFSASSTPTYVNLSSNQFASSVTTGRDYFCIMLNNGSTMCAGMNSDGQIGDGTIADKISPVFIDNYFTNSQSLFLGDTDRDGDGTVDWFDDYPNDPIRSVNCPEGSYGRYICTDSSRGHYVGSSGSWLQIECPIGTFQNSTGQSSCLSASAGHYVPSMGATSQTECPAGTYNPSIGSNSSSSCLITPAGFYSGAGSSQPNPCPAGTYNPTIGSNASTCLDASVGYYVPITGVINAGYHHTCAIDYLGELYCWGSNVNGILGQNDSGEASDQDALHNSNTPLNVSFGPGRTAVSVSMGSSHTCAILDNGSVNCWGQGQHTGTGSGSYVPIYTPLGTGRTAIAIDSGQAHTCAILDDGSLKCWGYNNNGQIANNSAVYYNGNPVDVYLGAGRTAVNISLGNYHTCVILDDSSLKCWGKNIYGQLGDGTTTDTCEDDYDSQGNPTFICENNASTASAIDLGTGRYAVAVSAGKQHTCAILDDGSMKCWGANGYGKLGDGTSTQRLTPVAVSFSASVTISKISAGGSHTCAITSDESLFCWGHDNYLGNGEYQCVDWNSGANDLCYTPVSLNLSAKEVSLGNEHTCAILDDANFWCWGENSEYRLGTSNSSSDEYHTAHLPEQTLMPTMAFGASFQTACPAGTYNPNNGSTSSSFCLEADTGHYVEDNSYTEIVYDSSQISAGDFHTCAILDDGSVSCWGYNNYGQLGDGTTTTRNTPTQTSSLGTGRTAVAITAGNDHTCAILDDGSVSCWGYNNYGQLGDGTTAYRTTPTQTSSLGTGRTAVAIAAGAYHTCAILDDGSVSCWGFNEAGQLGYGNSTDQTTPTQTSSLGTGTTAVAISAGYKYTCSILDDGSVSCWGDNTYGQIGDGTETDRSTPTQTSSLGTGRTAISISTGSYSTCAILDDGSVSCWGRNTEGQLGDGTTTDRSTPTQTSSLGTGRTAVAIAAESYHICAILDDGSASCWGHNSHGQLGNGNSSQITTPDQTTPTQTASLGTDRTAVAISAGEYHTCAILDDGSASCWGHNNNGQLGDGTTTDRHTPTQTSSLGTGRTALINTIFHAHTGQTSQTACSAGTYQASTGQTSCTDASAGYYVPTTGSATQTACAAGTYQPSTGQSSCIDADAGYYVGSTGSSSQTPCAVGTYQPSTGQSSCTDASPGYYVDTTASTTQTACALGTYQPSSGQSSCLDSSTGHYVGSTGSSSQTPCAAGTYQPSTGQSSCVDASAGYYVGSTGSSSQTPCAVGTYQSLTGQSSCIYASAGNYVDITASTTQTSCPTGTYQPSTGQSSCIDSSAGYYVDTTGSTNQTACGLGTFQNQTGQSSCTDASPGYYVDTTASTTQTACALGTYQPSTGQSSCVDASAGYYVDTTASTTQTACALGTYQPSTGQSSCVDASAGYYVGSTASTNQTACALGTYQPNTGQDSCIDAAAGYYVYYTGATGPISCTAGTYQPSTGQTSCIDASAGYYVPNIASPAQTACSPGTYQPSTGQSSCIDAPAGYFVNTTAATSPLACPLGSYQPLTGQTSCLLATPGHYVPLNGSSTQTPCLAGTYNPLNGSFSQGDCIQASTGNHVPNEGSASQIECLAGYFQNITGQSSCNPADPGYFVPNNASWFQVGCTYGTYQPNSGQANCLDASPGYYVPGFASLTQTECALGSYQPQSGETSCISASIGYYVDQSASTNQTSCPSGTSTTSNGSVSINDCYTDTDFDGIPDIIDPDDDNDGYLDDLDVFPLDPTEWIDTDSDGIGNNADLDDDNDGWSDITEIDCGDSDPLNGTSTPVDYDEDGICNTLDEDDDNDSYPDSNDDFPLDECAVLDTDGDGIPDWLILNCNTNLSEDIDDDNDGYNDTNDSHPLDSSEWFDTDNDGIGNNADTDDDGDNVPDQFDVFPLDPTEWMDTDGDGVGNNADTDNDDDGVLDTNDDFPNDANETVDTDGDGIGNNADDDDDGDGYLDIYDQFPLDSTEWIDTDLDGIGNNADPDDDGDGWTDNDEFICGSDELDANDVPDDSDGDGICDSEDDDSTGLGVIVDVISNPLVVGLFLLIGAIIIVTLFLQSRNQSSKINELERMIGDSTIIEDDEQFND